MLIFHFFTQGLLYTRDINDAYANLPNSSLFKTSLYVNVKVIILYNSDTVLALLKIVDFFKIIFSFFIICCNLFFTTRTLYTTFITTLAVLFLLSSFFITLMHYLSLFHITYVILKMRPIADYFKLYVHFS
jgi:hypothetical protein